MTTTDILPVPPFERMTPRTIFERAERELELEWWSSDPTTPEQVAEFYRSNTAHGWQLDAWHNEADRQAWTERIVTLAKRIDAEIVVDIGSGQGQDLAALRDAGIPYLLGVEPNDLQRADQVERGLTVVPTIDHLPPEALVDADLILCLDVLEHLPDPDAFLETWCTRPTVGTYLVERTTVWDTTTPLHLASNRGWSPGRTLEQHGWELLEDDDPSGMRLWRRDATAAEPHRVGVIQAIYGDVSVGTYQGMLALVAAGWRPPRHLIVGEGLLPRARSRALSYWWRDTADEICLMIDSDVAFRRHDAEKLVEWCRNGYDVVCAPLPLHDGSAVGIQTLPGTDRLVKFGSGLEPLEILSVSPGFCAIHRRVLDALVPTMQLVHENLPMSFWPLCLEYVEEIPQRNPYDGRALPALHAMLSEDWALSRRIRALGFKQYAARDILLTHKSSVAVSLANMQLVQQANAAARKRIP